MGGLALQRQIVQLSSPLQFPDPVLRDGVDAVLRTDQGAHESGDAVAVSWGVCPFQDGGSGLVSMAGKYVHGYRDGFVSRPPLQTLKGDPRGSPAKCVGKKTRQASSR